MAYKVRKKAVENEKAFLEVLQRQRKHGKYFQSKDFGRLDLDEEIAHTKFLINEHKRGIK